MANENMIQKHIDNFLAMLCGETPVDSNVRTSAEYWLKRLATGEGAGSTKKIYCHPIVMTFTGNSAISCMIFNNDPTPFTASTFIDWIDALYADVGEIIRIICSGAMVKDSESMPTVFMARRDTSPYYRFVARNSAGVATYLDFPAKSDFVSGVSNFTDGVNPIN